MENETYKAEIKWGENVEDTEEKKAEIEQAVKALIHALDNTGVESIAFSKIKDNGQNENTSEESGSGK